MSIENPKIQLNFLTARRVKLSVVGLFSIFISLVLINCTRTAPTETAVEDEPDAPVTVYAKLPGDKANYALFSHRIKEHLEFKCNACHQRTDNSVSPDYAGHSSCINCHLEQFVSENAKICSICHRDVKSAPAPMKSFPASFIEPFNMKFDHAVHERGGARPAQGCAACHSPASGASLSIPVGIAAHSDCFSCHTPNLRVGKQNLGTCNTCHAVGGYTRASTGGAAFSTSFTHDNHSQLDCTSCHSVLAGAAQPHQVGSPVVGMHHYKGGGTSCASCHNDQTAFGDKDFNNCKRCHLGQSFAQVPAF